jgi:hypothetical protein
VGMLDLERQVRYRLLLDAMRRDAAQRPVLLMLLGSATNLTNCPIPGTAMHLSTKKIRRNNSTLRRRAGIKTAQYQ